MTNLLALIDASTTATTVAKKSSGSSSYGFLIVIGLFAVVYVGFIRPRSRRQRQAKTVGTTLAVGDRVMSVGGIYGTVTALRDGIGSDDSTVDVEVSPGIVLTFLRRAVNARPVPAVADEDLPADPDDEGPDDLEVDDGVYADPEPYGDFDENGEFHVHGQTPAHEGHHPDGDDDPEDEGGDQLPEDDPTPGTPRPTGGTGSGGD